MDNINQYFQGEKIQCIIGLSISIFFIGASIYFLFQQKPELKGMAYSFLPLSVLLLIICSSVIIRTSEDVKRVTNYYESQAVEISSEELPRVEKVMHSFSIIKKVELVLIIVGFILLFALWEKPILRGIAFGMITQGIILYTFDHIAEARSELYIEFLKSL